MGYGAHALCIQRQCVLVSDTRTRPAGTGETVEQVSNGARPLDTCSTDEGNTRLSRDGLRLWSVGYEARAPGWAKGRVHWAFNSSACWSMSTHESQAWAYLSTMYPSSTAVGYTIDRRDLGRPPAYLRASVYCNLVLVYASLLRSSPKLCLAPILDVQQGCCN